MVKEDLFSGIRACLLKFIKNRKNTCSDTINIL